VPIALASGKYRSENSSLAGSEFVDTNLAGPKFHDVNLRGAVFSDVALTGATIQNACLGDVTIADANYIGMRIEGILVTELLRVYREHGGA
jgi:uncharacterized protein YjbI with pentapeptide repeats